MLLNTEWINNEIKEEIKNYLETNESEHTTTQNQHNTVKAVLREKFIALVIPQEARKISSKQSNPIPKRNRKTKPRKAQSR